MTDVFTIEGKIRRNDYQFKIRPKLSAMNFSDAMQRNRKVFKSKFLGNETVAISVWTTPKRTKTYPFARVYDTLSYDGIKITIIPAMVDYGKHGERGKIQPSTVDWMTSIGVYLILGMYVNAEKGKKGKLAANAGSKTQSSEGKPKFAQGQKFDTDGEYTRHFIPELANLPSKFLFNPWEAPKKVLKDANVKLGVNYPTPIVDIRASRARALMAFDSLK